MPLIAVSGGGRRFSAGRPHVPSSPSPSHGFCCSHGSNKCNHSLPRPAPPARPWGCRHPHSRCRCAASRRLRHRSLACRPPPPAALPVALEAHCLVPIFWGHIINIVTAATSSYEPCQAHVVGRCILHGTGRLSRAAHLPMMKGACAIGPSADSQVCRIR